MNIVCGFLDQLLYYFPELKHFECFSQDTVSCMLRQNSVYCYQFTCTYICNIQWYYHTELDSAWQFSYTNDVRTCNATENKVKE